MGAPRPCSLQELGQHGVFLSDHRPYDAAMEFYVLSEQLDTEVEEMWDNYEVRHSSR